MMLILCVVAALPFDCHCPLHGGAVAALSLTLLALRLSPDCCLLQLSPRLIQTLVPSIIMYYLPFFALEHAIWDASAFNMWMVYLEESHRP